jgi:hypothetical protein
VRITEGKSTHSWRDIDRWLEARGWSRERSAWHSPEWGGVDGGGDRAFYDRTAAIQEQARRELEATR